MTYFRYPGSLRIGVRNETVTAVAHPGVEAVEPKQMLLVLLNGHQRFRLGGTEIVLSTLMPGEPGPKALMLRIAQASQLEYLESHGRPLVKIAVSTDPDWLEEAGQDEEAPGAAVNPAGLMGQGAEGLSWRLWTPSDEMQDLARKVVEAHSGGAGLRTPGNAGNLALMSRAIELYRAALTALAQVPPVPVAPGGGDPRIAALVACLALHQDDAGFGPEELARGCGMGLRSLQRLLRRSLNCCPREFIRAQKLAVAYSSLHRGGVNVAQAAHIAGYASTASFSTAFKREFGLTPASVQDGH